MRLIGLAVVLAVSLVLAPWAAEAQRAAKAYKIGYLSALRLHAAAQSDHQELPPRAP